MNSDDQKHEAGLIKTELWLTPQQARVVKAVVEGMRTMSPASSTRLENIIQSVIEIETGPAVPEMPKTRR